MKKVLALVLCALMIVTAALPVLAVDGEPATQATEGPGPLAITEVLPKSPTEGYGYIEILNTSDSDIDLSNYYLFRIGFSNSNGNYYRTGMQQMLGLSGNLVHSGITAIKLNGTVKAHDVVVVMLNDKFTKAQFITHWNDQGADLNTDNVIDFDFANLGDNYTAKSLNPSYPTAIYSTTQLNFIPRNTYGMCTLALVPVAEANLNGNPDTWYDDTVNDDADTVEDETHNVSAKPYLEVADSIVVLNFMTTKHTSTSYSGCHQNLPTYSANFTAFIEEESFNASVDATVYPESVQTINKYYYDDLYPALAVSNPDAPCLAYVDTMSKNIKDGETVTNYIHNWVKEATKAVPLPKVSLAADPTPGELSGVQYGHGTDTTPKKSGLTITEVTPSTGEGTTRNNYEFIEVKNTSNSAINLSNYSIALFAGTNSGAYGATFVARTLNCTFGNDVAGNEWSYAKLSGSTLESGAVAVIAFNNDVDAFKTFWTNRGNDMTGVTVINATYSEGSNIAGRGEGFLPDAAVGYTISLFDDTKAAVATTWETVKTEQFNNITGYTEDNPPKAIYAPLLNANVNTIVSNADSVTLIIAKGKNEQNVSCNYFGYIDPARYVVEAGVLGMRIFAYSTSNQFKNGIIPVMDNLNVVVPKDQPVAMYINDSTKGFSSGANRNDPEFISTEKQNVAFVETNFDSVPTPGALLEGQFGYEADKTLISVAGYQTATEAVDGATDVRIIGKLNVSQTELANYDVIGIEVAAASEATDACLGYGTSGTVFANSVCTKQKEITIDKVYKKLTDEAGTEYTNGDNYMFAINLAGIPVENCNLTFRVYVKDTLGNKTYTGFYQITDTSI